MNPQPKKKRVLLTRAGKAELKRKLYYGRAAGKCETCGLPVPLDFQGYFNLFTCAHLSHKKHGSAKEDTEEGCLIECWSCHIGKKHSPQWTKKGYY